VQIAVVRAPSAVGWNTDYRTFTATIILLLVSIITRIIPMQPGPAQGVGDIGPRLGRHLSSTLVRGRRFQNTDNIPLLGAAKFDFD